ncbi:GDCCVxC domain-containing (seleno)protein [Maribacter aestuarii]|uniref:GDCCVxC domain-containing (seleno)protein n=1 Tax=Maribacter aestuarii TaxID=1130723 RepID=UPI00248BEA2D|nr:GDCCVxC domain-containing (seleno)protein [Maribacter aestuarii]
MELQLESTITCPKYHHPAKEKMSTTACQFFYECKNCNVLLKPKDGDCCVYCSYGTVKCPPIQSGSSCCN